MLKYLFTFSFLSPLYTFFFKLQSIVYVEVCPAFLKFNIFLAFLHLIKYSWGYYCRWFKVNNIGVLLPFYLWERDPQKLWLFCACGLWREILRVWLYQFQLWNLLFEFSFLICEVRRMTDLCLWDNWACGTVNTVPNAE